jgi:hypothetical protein
MSRCGVRKGGFRAHADRVAGQTALGLMSWQLNPLSVNVRVDDPDVVGTLRT